MIILVVTIVLHLFIIILFENIFNLPIHLFRFGCNRMSAFVISNPDVGDAKFAGVHHSRNVFVKPESRLARKNSFFVIITLVILAIVGIAIGLLAYFLAKGSSSSSKSTLPQFKGIVYIIP